MPQVSIITPLYNCSSFLCSTVDSILSQSNRNWELLLIDDSSTDSTLDIAKSYVANDSRVQLISMDRNSGPAKTRNAGIVRAQGRYIAFCDSDDIWMPDKLEKQLAVIRESQAAVCFTSYYKMLEDGTPTDRIVEAQPYLHYKMMLRSNYIGCSTAMYDTVLCGKVFMPDIIKRQDYGLWLRILSQGHIAVGLSEPLVYYRVRSNSVSSNKLIAAQYHWRVLRSATDVSFQYACFLFLQYAWLGFLKRRA